MSFTVSITQGNLLQPFTLYPSDQLHASMHMQLTFLMLEIWPKSMAEPARKTCEETLRLIASYGYSLHELDIPS